MELLKKAVRSRVINILRSEIRWLPYQSEATPLDSLRWASLPVVGLFSNKIWHYKDPEE